MKGPIEKISGNYRFVLKIRDKTVLNFIESSGPIEKVKILCWNSVEIHETRIHLHPTDILSCGYNLKRRNRPFSACQLKT